MTDFDDDDYEEAYGDYDLEDDDGYQQPVPAHDGEDFYEIDGELYPESALREHFGNLSAQEEAAKINEWEDALDRTEDALGRPLLFADEAVPLIQALETGGVEAAMREFDRISQRDLSDDDLRAAILAEMMEDGA